ncbi:LLM class flavin-dependent oxidoreductase [Blastococcus tunisiensis]|uniref:Probable F420-dependent oxidoreductase, Rv3093c family n=1 Tax=Blastococcus tunisiensis TaxID=1798228 RepID=A0A1I2A4S9_9ACTN|nr:LLM class flavin-dependent oxidoreductase [Blastococcus sp. DSM 46838]SFE38962.1 probable F420-dependent oxidoreductase, Rv3093c family [Blastococcus sp. DSM 46838]
MTKESRRAGMTLGVQNGLRVEHLPEVARGVEALGFTELWSEEAGGGDAVTGLAAAAMTTRSVTLGTGIVPVFGRAPAVVAMEAASLQLLSGGRFRLGLGASTPTIATSWRGEVYERPLARLMEYVDVVRRLLAGEKVTHHGQVHLDGYRLQLPTPLPPVPPLYLAALGERALTLAGQHADGAILGNMTPRGVAQAVEVLRNAAADSNRAPAAVDVIGRVTLLVDEDLDRARARVRRIAGFYLSTDVYRRSLTRQGFGDEVGRFAASWDAGERSRAVEQLSDEVLGAFAVFGDEQTVRSGIARFREAGLEAPILYPIVSVEGAPATDGEGDGAARLLAVASRLREA